MTPTGRGIHFDVWTGKNIPKYLFKKKSAMIYIKLNLLINKC